MQYLNEFFKKKSRSQIIVQMGKNILQIDLENQERVYILPKIIIDSFHFL